jgi:hypothetical protein
LILKNHHTRTDLAIIRVIVMFWLQIWPAGRAGPGHHVLSSARLLSGP